MTVFIKRMEESGMTFQFLVLVIELIVVFMTELGNMGGGCGRIE
jgi:hypothetical protein